MKQVVIDREQFFGMWQSYKIFVKDAVIAGLERHYPATEIRRKAMIIEALAFWRFIFNKLAWDNNGESEEEWKRRQRILWNFFMHDNPLISLIAMVESLPTAVWRKLLWKHNIDFMSFESFLRRISPEQIKAIEDSYDDLYGRHEIPGVFSWWDRFRGSLTVEKILSERYDYETRYANKGAMSYNLLNLDFGFNAYPNGVKDDEKVVEVSPMRFLSDKNHADDFVVNNETGGKYWWLYRKARSNYVWNQNVKVTLNKHICPGFWYTMFVHLLFWVISPIAFASLAGTIAWTSIAATPWWLIGLTGIFGVVMPLWLLGAAIKWLLNNVFMGVRDYWRDLYESHEELFDNIGIGVILAIVLAVLGWFTWLIYCFIVYGFGMAWSILIILAAYVYVVTGVVTSSEFNNTRGIMGFPWYLKIPIMAVTVSIVIKFVLTYPEEIMWFIMLLAFGFIGFFVAIWDALVALGAVSLLLVIPAAILGVMVFYFDSLDDKKLESAINKMAKVTTFLVIAVLLAIGGLIGYAIFRSQSVNIYIFFFFSVLGVALAVEWIMLWLINPKVKEADKEISHVASYSSEFRKIISKRMLFKNKWLQALDKEARLEALEKAVGLIGEIFYQESWRKACWALIPKMNAEILEAILQNKQGLRRIMSESFTLKVFTHMSSGKTYSQAMELARQESEAEERAREEFSVLREKAKRVIKRVFFPITILVMGWRKAAEYAKTLYRLYELFNRKCPYITERRVLKFN